MAHRKLCVKIESEVHSGSGVCVLEGDNSPFRDDVPKLASYSDSSFLKPHSTHFLVPMRNYRRIYQAERYVGAVNPPKNPMGTSECRERGFRYGES